MLRILGRDRRASKLATMAIRSESEIDLSSWEFVNPSDDEEEDSYSFTEEDLDDTDAHDRDDFLLKQGSIGSPSSDISMESLSPVQIIGPLLVSDVEVDYHDVKEEEEEEEDDDYDDDDEYDLDDELVPKWLSDKFGRQRIRKLGKKINPRMYKSKRGLYFYNRPGCVHGKHGLGVHHTSI